jgi:hypothetical protein
VELARKLRAEKRLNPYGRRPHRLTVDSGVHPKFVEQVRSVFGGNVAGGALDKGTAAHACQRRIEPIHATLERRVDVGKAEAARVVQVEHKRRVANGRLYSRHALLNHVRVGKPGGVGQGQRVNPHPREVAAHLHHLLQRRVARRPVAKDCLKAHLRPKALLVGVPHHRLRLRHGFVHGSVGVVSAVLVVGSDGQVHVRHPRGHRPLQPFRVQDEPGVRHVVPGR